MTAAVVTLAVLAAALGAGLLATVYALNAKTKEIGNVLRREDRLILQVEALTRGDAEHRDRIARLQASNDALAANLAIAQARAVAGLSDSDLVDVINSGLLPNPDRPSAGPGADEERAVPDKPRAGSFGAHGDDLS